MRGQRINAQIGVSRAHEVGRRRLQRVAARCVAGLDRPLDIADRGITKQAAAAEQFPISRFDVLRSDSGEPLGIGKDGRNRFSVAEPGMPEPLVLSGLDHPGGFTARTAPPMRIQGEQRSRNPLSAPRKEASIAARVDDKARGDFFQASVLVETGLPAAAAQPLGRQRPRRLQHPHPVGLGVLQQQQ